MNWILKLVWMLFAAAQVQSAIIPEESFRQETKIHAQQTSYLPQPAVVQSNQNYNLRNQQLNNANTYGNPTLSNPPNNAAESVANFQKSPVNQQRQLAGTQQNYAINPHGDSTVYQSQHNSNLNTAANSGVNNQASYANSRQTHSVQTAAQNAPAAHEQNSYNGQASTSSRDDYNSYSNRDVQFNDQANKGNSQDARRIYPYPALDLGDAKTKSSRKIPLVLITIQKNKNSYNFENSKTDVKKQSYDPVPDSHLSHNTDGNRADASQKIASNAGHEKNLQNNYEKTSGEVQNNAQTYSGNQQQQYQAQSQVSPAQISQVMINQRSNGQLSPYRYPILAGKKVESSEWRPVDKTGIRTPDNRNAIPAFPQPSSSQQRNLAQNQQRNTGSSLSYESNSNSAQNLATNHNVNTGVSQYNQNVQSPNSPSLDSTQNTGGKADYQVTSTFVRQANINFDDNTGYSQASATNNKQNDYAQNSFVSNNVQDIKGGSSQQDREKFPNGVNDNHRQTSAIGNTAQFSSHSILNQNYNQAAARGSSNYRPAVQGNVNQNFAAQTSHNNLGERNNQLHFSSNAQVHFGQNTLPQQTAVNNAQGSTVANKNDGKLEQKVYAPNSYNAQSQENNFAKFSLQQAPISTFQEENKNSGISQNANYGSNQQFASQNSVKPYQQTTEHFSVGQRNTHNDFSENRQQNSPTQGNYFQSSVKTAGQTNQNYFQTQNENIRSDTQNNGYVSNQENRNSIFQNDDRLKAPNNRQNDASRYEYNSGNVGFNTQLNKEPVKSQENAFSQKQETSRNSENQSAGNNHGFNNYGNARNFQVSANTRSNDNKDINRSYGDAQGQGPNTFQSNSYGRYPNSAANFQSDQQSLFDSSARNQKTTNFENVASSSSGSALNNYQNTNYGSSESQDSVVGAKPDENTPVNQRYSNDQHHSDGTKYEQSNENKEATSKEVNKEEETPEALLLVLVSAKKSALEGQSDEEEEEMNQGYESAPVELVDFLNDETNRKMFLESIQDAANVAYEEQEKLRDQYSEELQESSDDAERQ